MIDPHQVPPVSPGEWLARFVTQSSQYRRGDQTVKQDAFIPHPHQALSVTRHLQASDVEIWDIGRDVAGSQGRTLYGRADIQAVDCLIDGLRLEAKPVVANPNHADISNWPTAKQDQKAIALKLAAAARFVPCPDPS